MAESIDAFDSISLRTLEQKKSDSYEKGYFYTLYVVGFTIWIKLSTKTTLLSSFIPNISAKYLFNSILCSLNLFDETLL